MINWIKYLRIRKNIWSNIMEAKKEQLLQFLTERIQLHIPLYQRNYSWTKRECKTLLEDIIQIGSSSTDATHFLGAIVYLKQQKVSLSPIENLTLIDGQQRITTLMLLISAITHFLQEHPNDILRTPEDLASYYLINERERDSKYKIILSDHDNVTLQKIIDNVGYSNKLQWNLDDSVRIKENFNFFTKSINDENIEKIFNGLAKLEIILIALAPNQDNPQLIFESLNSTGKELNKSDLIRNYLLMGLDLKKQEELYSNYWIKIEKGFRHQSDKVFDDFIKYYLTIKLKGDIPPSRELYETFKNYAQNIPNKKELVEDLYKYANYLFKIINLEEEDDDIKKELSDLRLLKVDSSNTFLLSVYDDYENNVISKQNFLELIKIIESYVIRRDVCGYRTNYYNKVFGKLYWEIDKHNYMDSFKAALIFNTSSSRKFPTDEEVSRLIKDIDITKDKKSILIKIENYIRNDKLDLQDYEVEHILPNKYDLDDSWKEMLGPDFYEIQKNYSGTLGNLTLLPEAFKNKSFEYKCNTNNGFKESSLVLNQDIVELDVWNKESIINRSKKLSKYLLEIWTYPHVEDYFKKENKSVKPTKTPKKSVKSIKSKKVSISKFLKNNSINMSILNSLTQKIYMIDSDIERIDYDTSIEFIKDDDIIVKLIPRKSHLVLLLNIPVSQLNDPRNMSVDISELNSELENTEIIMDSINDVNYVYQLIKQEYDYLTQ